MKKPSNKIARHGHYHRLAKGIYGLGLGYYGSPDYSPYYAYPLVVITVQKVPPVNIQKNAPLIWAPRLLQDKYSQLITPTEINIVANYTGRFI